MPKSHPPGLLACSLLVLAAHYALGDSTKSAYRNPIVQDTCPVLVKVGKEFGQALVPLQETLQFSLKPNRPTMSVRIQGEDSLYKASVDGTMIKLFGCDAREANCALLNEGGTKSSDLLVVDQWNLVEVKYIDGKVTVDINMKSNVMGGNMMSMTKGSSKGQGYGAEYLTFVVPPFSPFYDATLQIPCDVNGNPPYITTAPPVSSIPPTTTSPTDSRPFPGCPLYRVEADHPTPTSGEPIPESFTFAVYPSHPALHMDVFSDQIDFKFRVNGPWVELHKCNMVGRNCALKGRTGGAHNILEPSKWNEVTIFLQDDKLFIKVNNSVLLSSSLESGAHRGLKMVVMAPQDIVTEGSEHFVAMVNVQCVGIDQQIIHPGTAPTPTQGGLPTKDAVVETSTKAAPSGVSSVSRDVSIVVGVLVGVLLIIAVAIVISTYMKRRAVTLNEHSPLQTQYRQQD